MSYSPIIKNLDFALARARFFEKSKVWVVKRLLRVLRGSLSIAVGAPGGFLGALLVLLGAPGNTPNSKKGFLRAPMSPDPDPRGTLNSPKQLPRRLHGEGDGPTKPPRPIWRRMSTYPFAISEAKSTQHMKQGTSPWPFKATIGARVSYSYYCYSYSASP